MSESKPRIALKKHKELDTVWHPESGLVFKSVKERTVTGQFLDNTFISLNKEIVDLCKKWGFKYDVSLYTEADEEEADEEEDDEDVKGEEDEDEGEEDDDTGDSGGEEQVDEPTTTTPTPTSTIVVVDPLDKFSKLSSSLNVYVQDVINDFSSKISILETNLQKKNNDYKSLEDMYVNTKAEHEKLKAKFEGLKNFFN